MAVPEVKEAVAKVDRSLMNEQGIDWEVDFKPWLGPEIAVALTSLRGVSQSGGTPDLVIYMATRDPASYGMADLAELIQYGASPRATINLTLAAKASAFLRGRGYVVPQDVKDMAPDVLRHRVIVSYEAEAEQKTSADVVRTVLEHVAVP